MCPGVEPLHMPMPILPEPTIEDEMVEEADESPEGEQVAPSEPGSPPHSPRPKAFIESSRFEAFGAFRFIIIHGWI